MNCRKLISCSISVLLLALLIGGALYMGVPGLRRRVDYLPRRIEMWWRERQPHPLYVPTPVPTSTAASPTVTRAPLPRPTVTEQPTIAPSSPSHTRQVVALPFLRPTPTAVATRVHTYTPPSPTRRLSSTPSPNNERSLLEASEPTLTPMIQPVLPSAPTPTAPSGRMTYVVQPGDSLSTIAQRFGTSVQALVWLNNISNPSLIRVGWELVIPAPGEVILSPTPWLALPTLASGRAQPAGPISATGAVLLKGFRHEWQTLNNCGPATLAMTLSHYGRSETQADTAAVLKPNYDDKHVSPEEMAAYSRSLGLGALVRVGGDIDQLKLLLSSGFPVIVETWFIPRPKDEVGHYRLLTGFDDVAGHFITHDSYNGPDVTISYEALDAVWRVFNRLYLVIYRPDQAEALAIIIGKDMDDTNMYQHALEVAQAEAAAAPNDPFAWFNVGNNQTGLACYDEAAVAYDRARILGLPWRMLWYQFGPFEAYYAIGRYQDMLDLAEANLATARDLEESYYYRGRALQALGELEAARQAYQAALRYNPNFTWAAEALAKLGAGG